MVLALLSIAVGLLVLVVILQAILLRRNVTLDLSSVQQSLASVEKAFDRTDLAVREEIGKNRTEAGRASSELRQEVVATLKGVGDSLGQQMTTLAHSNDEKLVAMRETIERRLQAIQDETGRKLEQVRIDASASAKDLREGVVTQLKGFNESLVASIGEISKLQKGQLDSFAQRLELLTTGSNERLGTMRDTIEQRLGSIQEENGKQLGQAREEASTSAQKTREEVAAALKLFKESVEATLVKTATEQLTGLAGVVAQLEKLIDSSGKSAEAQRTSIDERLREIRTDATTGSKEMREEVSASLKSFNESILKLTATNHERMDLLKAAVEDKLKTIHEENAKQLEQMRLTVDEKLQGTLEKRLGESFKQVSDRLEAVHKGLGEMQTLATGVGDLKKVLSNVKTRAGWSEVQLGAMLEQVLAPDQFARNVATKGEGERVEYAVKLPGRGEDPADVLWLPIDAKFPVEVHQRLLELQERGEKELAEAAWKELERCVRSCASDIAQKYINPPKTTDFGIMFLPTEGLFADVVRRTGLCESLHRDYRVVVTGPTTLWSILNSFQMGFRTLAIQQRTSEVWSLLGAVKTEWGKYGDILDQVKKKIDQASNTIDDAARKSRVIGRKLRDVQELPHQEAHAKLMLETEPVEEETPAKDSASPSSV